ncbi:hypothetical protein CEUSTIGMA_g7865.t1 [Chlamydomonas eustigma]|uniref:W2 domain-containing protein n=1 Tax=Chlamydomonas eustigma TaxID=1157962 RepID=A0A250XBJ0_9CHLO|nr:hypothetical protein CEUSTIGMA_g7865.t1 [Chlamydomonas eustigma]|eukprot:GAX80426.1 hypothetical protein CEUSTIGMA_g7865.t1 [Chlamydomonas eustigma]
MGVQGLSGLLEKYGRAQVVCRHTGSRSTSQENVLLVDAPAVQQVLLDRLGWKHNDWRSPAIHAQLYHETCRFYAGIQRCGLRCVLICDGACSPGLEALYASIQRERVNEADQLVPPTLSMVMYQAYHDLGLKTETSILSAEKLLLAWYYQHKAEVFAVLTDNSDFYVHGVTRVVHVRDVVIDPESVTLHAWNTPELWRNLQMFASRRGTRGSPHISLMQRAQVAAILGCDAGKGIRTQPAPAIAPTSEGPVADVIKKSGAFILCPSVAAQEVLLRDGDPLQLSFFRSEPLSVKGFGEEDLSAFNQVVEGYLQDDRAARGGASALASLSLAGALSVPWLGAARKQYLSEAAGAIPELMTQLAFRGFACLPVPEPWWNQLRGLGAVIDKALFSASVGTRPGIPYALEPSTCTLHPLTSDASPSSLNNGSSSDAASPSSQHWFEPSCQWPAVQVSSQTLADDPTVSSWKDLLCSTAVETAVKIQETLSDLPPTLTQYSALVLHACQQLTALQLPAACGEEEMAHVVKEQLKAARALLLPGVPMPEQLLLSAAGSQYEKEEAGAEGEVLSRSSLQRPLNVGSGLKEEDWDQIDDDEVALGKVRSGAGFILMGKVRSYNMTVLVAAASLELPAVRLFQMMYSASLSVEGAAGRCWGSLAKSCFPSQHSALTTGDKAALKAREKDIKALGSFTDLLAGLRNQKDSVGLVAAGWFQQLLAFVESGAVTGNSSSTSSAAAALALSGVCRHALRAGPDSPQWRAAQVCWSASSTSLRELALSNMWLCSNSTALSHGGAPMRYPHQQELMDMVDEHLRQMEEAEEYVAALARRGQAPASGKAGGPEKPQPLHIILSTPTGSGKTFTAVMMHLHLLRVPPATAPVDAGYGGSTGKGHPEIILVYAVPTKQVLLRVGRECLAHGIVYWTASKAGGELYQVRRPYSIRTQRRVGAKAGTSSMRDQLERTEALGRNNHDLGGGTPHMIIADVFAAAALMKAATEANTDDWYHSSKIVLYFDGETDNTDDWYHSCKIVLYFDEPNMGIHLDPELRSVVKDIMRWAPPTTILASATLPSWDQLPVWWKGNRAPATRTVISMEPYTLPMSQLEVLKCEDQLITPVNILQLFSSFSEFSHAVSRSKRLRVLILRHLQPSQANRLLLSDAETVQSLVKGGGGSKGGDSQGQSEDGSSALSVLGQDVRSLRESIEPILLGLDSKAFEELKREWSASSRPAENGLRSVISKQGVTMIATVDARKLALELAGRWRDEEEWSEAIREVRAKVSAAQSSQKVLDKEKERSQKKDKDNGPEGSSAAYGNSTVVTLRSGLWITIEEARDTEDNILVMLSKGIAYACAEGTELVVSRLYQQALLYIPEAAVKLPPIHVLVVDYSAIYGTDCAAVDTIVMQPDLGDMLSWEDHQQFIGRLRRDGTAVYPSLKMLRWATTGVVHSDDSEDDILPQKPLTLKRVLNLVLERAGCEVVGEDATVQLTNELTSLRQHQHKGGAGGMATRADVAACVLAVALLDLLGLPANVGASGKATLYKAVVARLQQWGPLKPMQLMQLPSPAEQGSLLICLQGLCEEGIPSSTPSAAVAAVRRHPGLRGEKSVLTWAGGKSGEKSVLTWAGGKSGEESVLTWAGGKSGASSGVKSAMKSSTTMSPFRAAVQPFVEWLQEAEEDEDDEDEDEDDE